MVRRSRWPWLWTLAVAVSPASTWAAGLCPGDAAADGDVRRSGWPASAPQVASAALRLNQEGAQLYKQRRYEEAAAQYRAADAADPSFLAPRLNLASLRVRQERFDEAAATLSTLFEAGYVPWVQAAREATDLAALWARQGQYGLAEQSQKAARLWGAKVMGGIPMLSRLREPVKLAREDGPSSLFPQQEIVSWDPRTQRFHQVTSHGGRVLLLTTSLDRSEVVYLTAEKLRRVGGVLRQFEGVTVHRLRLSDLQPLAKTRLSEGVVKAEFSRASDGTMFLQYTNELGEAKELRVERDTQAVAPALARKRRRLKILATLTVAGTQPSGGTHEAAGCALQLQDDFTATPATIKVRVGRRWLALPSRYGLALNGFGLSTLSPAP